MRATKGGGAVKEFCLDGGQLEFVGRGSVEGGGMSSEGATKGTGVYECSCCRKTVSASIAEESRTAEAKNTSFRPSHRVGNLTPQQQSLVELQQSEQDFVWGLRRGRTAVISEKRGSKQRGETYEASSEPVKPIRSRMS
jgi:hypothetical protein